MIYFLKRFPKSLLEKTQFREFGRKLVNKEELTMRVGDSRLQEFYYNEVQHDLMIKQFEIPDEEKLLNNPLLKEVFQNNPLDKKPRITHDLKMKSATQIPFKIKKVPIFLRPPKKTPEQKQNERELREIITYKSIPKIDKITLEIECLQALKDKYLLTSSFLILQSITGKVGETLKSKVNDATILLRVGHNIGCKVELRKQDEIYEFMDKLTELVIPRIKQFNNGVSSNVCIDKGNCTLSIDGRMLVHFFDVQSIYESLPILNDLKIIFNTNCENKVHTAMLLRSLKVPVNIDPEIEIEQPEEVEEIIEEEIVEEPTKDKKKQGKKKK